MLTGAVSARFAALLELDRAGLHPHTVQGLDRLVVSLLQRGLRNARPDQGVKPFDRRRLCCLRRLGDLRKDTPLDLLSMSFVDVVDFCRF